MKNILKSIVIFLPVIIFARVIPSGIIIECDGSDSVTHAIYSDTTDYAIYADSANHCSDLSNISFFSSSYDETLYTYAGDTTTADTSDMVCYSGSLWDCTYSVGNILKTNTGAWPTATIFNHLDLIINCYASYDEFSIASYACTESTTFWASSYTDDTLFVYFPHAPGVDCSPKDSAAIYSDGSKWHPVCITTYAWTIYSSYCYTRHYALYAIINGDTLSVNTWQQNF